MRESVCERARERNGRCGLACGLCQTTSGVEEGAAQERACCVCALRPDDDTRHERVYCRAWGTPLGRAPVSRQDREEEGQHDARSLFIARWRQPPEFSAGGRCCFLSFATAFVMQQKLLSSADGSLDALRLAQARWKRILAVVALAGIPGAARSQDAARATHHSRPRLVRVGCCGRRAGEKRSCHAPAGARAHPVQDRTLRGAGATRA